MSTNGGARATYPDLAGKRVLITGGATGIGEALVRGFAAQGAAVTFLDIQKAPGDALAAQLPGACFLACDLADPEALAQAAASAQAAGPFDVLINNAAHDLRQPAADVTAQDWRRGLAVNLDPQFLLARALYPGMKQAGGGVIINLSSINPLLGLAGMAAYVAAKGAVNALTKALAREWGPDRIRVNVISPGWVVTDRQLALWLTPEAEKAWMDQVALKERLMPEDIARTALFLASDEARMITGQNIVVDGGRT